MTRRSGPVMSLVAVGAFMGWIMFMTQRGPVGDQVPAPEATSDGVGIHETDVAPCVHPVRWRLADVDPRFRVDRARLVHAAREAAALWGSWQGSPLLTEDGHAGLPIRLVYDGRQARIRTRLDGEAAGSTLPDTAFEAAVYRKISWEAGGGSRGTHREIRVHAFAHEADLVVILAHEFGHALGLAHSSDPAALMSPERRSAPEGTTDPAVTAADRLALEELCGTSEDPELPR